MKNKKTNLLILGIISTMMLSTSPTFAATNTNSNSNSSLILATVGNPSLTANVSKSSISKYSGASVVSGYAKDSNGNPLVNAIIWVTVDSTLYAELHTNSLGYYSTTIYGADFDGYGYFAVNVYIDNGTSNNGTQIGYGTYQIDHNVWADVKTTTSGIFIHN